MTTTKKIGSIITASALLMLSTVPCFAATDDELKADILTHEFKAYQIFSATSVEGEYLTDINWGSAFTKSSKISSFLSKLKTEDDFEVNGENIFAECTNAEETAMVLSQYEDYSDIANSFAKYATSSGCLTQVYDVVTNGDIIEDAGYYIFEDASGASVINPTILKMVANGKVEIEVKASVPQMEKKVMENSYDVNYESLTLGTNTNSGFAGIDYGEGYNDVADYSIGDTVPFRLFGTMASRMNEYDTYYYAFVDQLSAGLTYTQADADDTTVSLYNLKNGTYQYANDVTDFFDVTFKGNTEITIACDDVLEIPGISATSILVVDYNATLNDDAVVGYDGNLNVAYLEYSNNPSVPDSTGTTEEDKVIVFTYMIDVTKVDDEGNELADAEFYLLNADGEYYADGTWVADKKDAVVLVSDEDGNFKVKGLDEGEYTLVEKKAPTGFKTLENEIVFEVIANILPDVNDDEAQLWTSTATEALDSFIAKITSNEDKAASITVNENALSADLEVINTKVFDLPGTGGMGTTFIYLAGAAFVLLGVALIVVKRRANS